MIHDESQRTHSPLTLGQANTAAAILVAAITQATAAPGGALRVPGLGTFERRERAARTARNPQTGAALEIPAHSVLAFRPAGCQRREGGA